MRIFITLLCLFYSSKTISAQHMLRLMSSDEFEGVLIEAGEKIGYKLNHDPSFYRGEISSIRDSSIVIDNKEVFLSELSLITLKANSKKNILGGLAVFALEGALLGAKEIADIDSKILSITLFYTFIPAVALGTFLTVRGIINWKKDDKYPIGDEDWSIAIVPLKKK